MCDFQQKKRFFSFPGVPTSSVVNPVFDGPSTLGITVTSTLKLLGKLVFNYSVHSFRQMSINMSNRRLLSSRLNLGYIKNIVNQGQGNEKGRGWWW
jgi:hypothetical protein